MPGLLNRVRSNRRTIKAQKHSHRPVLEPMERRTLLSAAIAPLGVATNALNSAIDLGSYKLHTSHAAKGSVGAVAADVFYKVELTAEMNLGLTLSHLLQQDTVLLLYADGTMVNNGWVSTKSSLVISQHLVAGTYFIDVQHGYVADTSLAAGASNKVKVAPVKKYHLKNPTAYTLSVKGVKPDNAIAPQEPAKPAGFGAAFADTGAAAEPTVDAQLTGQSGFAGYQAFTTAEGYQLWGTGGPLPDDVIQQHIGDCYYMSIISSIARDNPGMIEKDIVPQADGTFVVKFQSAGQEVDEQIDDTLPVNTAGQTVFAGIADDKALWPAILEKAWCYFRPSSTDKGSYDGIELGYPSESLKAFGSTNAQEVATATFTTAPQLLTEIQGHLAAGDLADVGTISPQNWPASDPALPSGLFTGHEYSVITIDVADNKIQLRNPWATNTNNGGLDGSNGYITLTGDQLIKSIDDYSWGSLTAVTPDPNPTPTPTVVTPTPVPVTTTHTQTIAENLGPDSFQTDSGSNYDVFSFTANTTGQADISITSAAFTPELLVAEDDAAGWMVDGADKNTAGATTIDVTFTATAGITYAFGVFAGGTVNTGVYTVTLNGDLSAPVQQTSDAATGSLTGVVYDDSNGDGLQDNGEAGVTNASVYIDLNGTGQFVVGDPTTTTDSNGSYQFTGLQPGNYTIYVETPAGYTQTSPTANGGNPATVVAGQATTVADFGENTVGGGGITGNVYSDTNGNGTQDAGEVGLSGWYVYIDLGNTGSYADGDPYVVTDSTGHYSFQGLAPGSYHTRIYGQSGFTTTQGNSGWINTVTASSSSVGGDFGELQASGGSITGVVYDDANDDGSQNTGEVGLAGWQVYLDLNDSGTYAAGDPIATTDSTGTYTFTGLAAGDYVVGVVGQSGYTTNERSTEWDATVTAGSTSDGGSFGESQAAGNLSGVVYVDTNRNGTRDSTETGISNWTVYIDLDNSGSYETADPYVLTDSSGAYSFTGLAPGTYTIRAYVYSGTRWVAFEGSTGWSATVLADQTSFSGNFGEHFG